MDKGTVSNLTSVAVLGTGFLLPRGVPRDLVISASIFALSGGITNALAVKMLFDRIPGLIGSGVIPARFREIRAKVKDLIMEHFFDEEHLRGVLAERDSEIDWNRYLKQVPGGRDPVVGVIERQWVKITAPEVVQPIIDQEIEKLLDSSVGGMLSMAGMDNVKPVVNQFVSGLVASMEVKVLEAAERASSDGLTVELDEDKVIRDLRIHVDYLLVKKLEQLDADRVKKMMEDVIRHHLGWLVVWGNVFGAVLGLAAFFIW